MRKENQIMTDNSTQLQKLDLTETKLDVVDERKGSYSSRNDLSQGCTRRFLFVSMLGSHINFWKIM